MRLSQWVAKIFTVCKHIAHRSPLWYNCSKTNRPNVLYLSQTFAHCAMLLFEQYLLGVLELRIVDVRLFIFAWTQSITLNWNEAIIQNYATQASRTILNKSIVLSALVWLYSDNLHFKEIGIQATPEYIPKFNLLCVALEMDGLYPYSINTTRAEWCDTLKDNTRHTTAHKCTVLAEYIYI